MGLNSSSKVKWKATGLTIKSVQDLNLGRKIDVDGNALAFKMHTSNKVLGETLHLMAYHLKQLAFSGGFVITVIFDGSYRPDCKRASLERRKKSYVDNANRIFCRFKALELSSKFERGRDPTIKEELDLFNAECSKLESSCSKQLVIPGNVGQLFSERLMMAEACCPNENGGYVEERVLTSTFQADALIAHRFKGGFSDLIYGNDSDYFVLLGRDCIMMWNMKVKNESRNRRGNTKRKHQNNNESTFDATTLEVELYGSSNEVMKQYEKNLATSSLTLPKDLKWDEAKYPFFDNPDPVLRAIIAIVLGCDVYEGIKGWGPAKVEGKINDLLKKQSTTDSTTTSTTTCNETVVAGLKSLMQSTMKADANIVDTLIASFIYEPGIIDTTKSFLDDVPLPSDNDNGGIERSVREKYVHQPPEDYVFPTYLKSFDVRSTGDTSHIGPNDIEHYGPPLYKCGCFNGYRQHFYLQHEGRHQCAKCTDFFCKTCTFIPQVDKTKRKNNDCPVYYKSKSDKVLCLDCFKSTRHGENDQNDDIAITTNTTSLETMRRVLNSKVGLQLSVDNIAPAEVIDMYNMYIASSANSRDAIHLDSASKRIKFPFFPSEYIDDEKKFVRLGECFELSNGGRFISDPATTADHHIPSVLNILASLLKYDDESLPQNDDIFTGKYDYLPSLFLKMAYYSRVDSGYRLLDRCARHTCDPKSPSIITQTAQFFEYEEPGGEESERKKGEYKSKNEYNFF